MVNTKEWLDDNYPLEERSQMKKLDVSNKNLEGKLNLEGFTDLTELDCSFNSLTELDLSSCNPEKLTHLDLKNNNISQDLSFLSSLVSLEALYIRGNPFYGSLEPLKYLNRLAVLDIRETNINQGLEYLPLDNLWTFYCSSEIYEIFGSSEKSDRVIEELKVFQSLFLPHLKKNEELIAEIKRLKAINSANQDEIAQLERENMDLRLELDKRDNIRNILLIGRTGSGKSTLANVITGTDKFKTSDGSISQTKDMKVEGFNEDGIEYRVIDTIGIGDTELTEEQVLDKISEVAHYVRYGLSQVLFVAGGRFTKEEIMTYELLSKTIFDSDIAEYTSIVRTNFPGFEDERLCEEDRQKLQAENTKLSDIIDPVKIIHVDNPPLIGRSAVTNKEIREASQKKLLEYLATCEKIYRPKNLKELAGKNSQFMGEKEKLEKEITRLKKKVISEGKRKAEDQETMESLEKQITEKEKKIRNLEKKIRQQTSEYINEKWKIWGERGKILLRGVATGITTASIVLPGCKIM